MPATSTPNPDDMIDSIMKSNHASEVELGVLIATLRMTTSQIRIEGAVGKELAVKNMERTTDMRNDECNT